MEPSTALSEENQTPSNSTNPIALVIKTLVIGAPLAAGYGFLANAITANLGL